MFDRISNCIKDIQKDFHCKVASDLCTKFDNIIISRFEYRDMAVKNCSKLKAKTVRQMTTLAYGKFRVRLSETAKRMGKNVFVDW